MGIDSIWIGDVCTSRELPLHSKDKSVLLLIGVFNAARDKRQFAALWVELNQTVPYGCVGCSI
jgi:hypothetical protein